MAGSAGGAAASSVFPTSMRMRATSGFAGLITGRHQHEGSGPDTSTRLKTRTRSPELLAGDVGPERALDGGRQPQVVDGQVGRRRPAGDGGQQAALALHPRVVRVLLPRAHERQRHRPVHVTGPGPTDGASFVCAVDVRHQVRHWSRG